MSKCDDDLCDRGAGHEGYHGGYNGAGERRWWASATVEARMRPDVEYHDQRIFLYPLEAHGRFMVRTRKGSDILGMKVKADGLPYLIVAVPTNETEEEIRWFRAVSTGDRFNREILTYVGEVMLGGNGNEPYYSMYLFEYETAFMPSKNPEIEDDRWAEDLRELRNEALERKYA